MRFITLSIILFPLGAFLSLHYYGAPAMFAFFAGWLIGVVDLACSIKRNGGL